MNSKPASKREDQEKLPPAVILAGGLGTRLRSAYVAGPKSMAPVGGRPFLDYVLRWLRSEGVEEVILCVGYKRASIQRYVGGGRKWGLRVKYSIEQKLLGTGGAVKKAEGLIAGERLLVMNGDTLVGVNLRELVKFHRSQRAWATLGVVKVADDRRYGTLKMDHDGRITAFLEKTERETSKGRKDKKRPINGGVYVFEKKLLSKIHARGPLSLENKVFPWLAAGRRVYGFVSDTYFVDIGVPDDLRRAQNELRERFGFSNPD
jgi:D-glycero-alpha-D-manno-heptose 1-phosphate guanylyltransferase